MPVIILLVLLLLPVKLNVQFLNLTIKGSCCGPDGLSGEHFLYAPNELCVFLCNFFNLCISHSYFPESFMLSHIVPILKDKTGVISDKDNYRGIAISTLISKICESILLEKYEDVLWTQENQFGNKTKVN